MKVTADDIAQLLASAPPRLVPAHVVGAAQRGGSSWGTAVFGLVFGTFGLLFVGFFFPWQLVNELRLASGAAEAPGTVTAVNDANMRVNRVRVMEYQFTFTTAAGERQTAECFESRGRWAVNDSVVVRYLPGDPALACIVGGRLTKTGWFGCFVIIFPVVGYSMVGWFVVQRRQIGRLLRTGQLAEVDVLSVTATNMQVNKQQVYALLLSGAALGAQPVKVKRLNRADIALAQRQAEQKQPVFVLYDPRKPTRMIFPEALIEP